MPRPKISDLKLHDKYMLLMRVSATQTSCFHVDIGSSIIIVSVSIHFCIQNVLLLC